MFIVFAGVAVLGWPSIGPCVVRLPPTPLRRLRVAPTQDTAEVGTFRLGTYNIGAQNSSFEKISEEVYASSTCTDVLCLQSISPGWVTRLVDVLKWHVIDANDWTATLWRHGVHMTM